MATLWVLPVCLLLSASLRPQDRYSISLPEGWRRLTPDEVRILRPKLPSDLREMVLPGTLDRFGPVDKWLSAGFDGRCLTVAEKEGEPPVDAEGLARIRSWVEAHGTYVSGKQATVGPNGHPVLEVVSRRPPDRFLEVYAPTGGRLIIFQFRAHEEDFAAALPLFRKALGTLVFAREPKGAPKLSDRLQNAAIVGAIVGVVLLVLYKWSRKT